MTITALPEYDLFGMPPIQKMVEKTVPNEHRPISNISSPTSPIYFDIHTGLDEYIHFKETQLSVTLRVNISRPDGAKITDEDWKKVWPVNYLLNSWIKSISVTINGENVNSAHTYYAYKAYLEALIGLNTDAKNSYLTGALWYQDNYLSMEECDDKRCEFIKGNQSGVGKQLDLYGKLHLDLSMQEKALIGGLSTQIVIYPQDPKFYIKHDDSLNVNVEILDISLFVYRSKINHNAVLGHMSGMKIAKAKYYITRTDVKTFPISQNTMDANLDSVQGGVLPRRIFVFFVTQEASNGSSTKNPFNFQHFNINHIAANIDGEQFPLKAYKPDFENQKYTREYVSLFEAANQNEVTSTISISREEFGSGFTIFGFNFAPDLSDGAGMLGHLCEPRRGNLRLEIKFTKALSESINAIVYCEFDNCIQIDIDRKVYKNF